MRHTASKIYQLYPTIFNTALIVLLVWVMILSDWSVLNVSIGDFLLVGIVLLLLSNVPIDFSKKQQQLFIISTSSIILITLLAYITGPADMNIKLLLFSNVKLMFYIGTVMMIYNYISSRGLKPKFVRINTYMSLLVIAIGIVIIYLILTEQLEILHKIWYFTRIDDRSYHLGSSDIIRMRSLFAEPAHLGFYLNISLYFVLKQRNKYWLVYTVLISIGIVLTLSYSMIMIGSWLIMSTIAKHVKLSQFKWDGRYLIVVAVMLLIALIFGEFLYEAIYIRTLNILSGEDGSAIARLMGSWQQIDSGHLLFGVGAAHSTNITNMYAYALSDFGIIGLLGLLAGTGIIFTFGLREGVFFTLMNISKGGYLNPLFWLFILVIGLTNFNHKHTNRDGEKTWIL
ncbi:hypothetical protein BWX42_03460 [Dolosigranulum pigrum]|uniref:Uncharacterized protein n=1 Tax=Dolosigranulum pigrum TaxID=29394 RepID=A0A1S8KMM3_9LACT|nr:hypothetical protein BWX42_03460 [Dolosigranulum pigrum]